MTEFFEWVDSLAPRRLREAHPEVRRFIKFAAVGFFGLVIDFTVLNILVIVFGVPKEYAKPVSATCAIFSNFTWNRLWTFPESQDHPLHTQFGQFALVNLVGLGINYAVFISADKYIFQPLLLPYDATMFNLANEIAFNLANACAIGVVLFWNFGANRFWTYRHIK